MQINRQHDGQVFWGIGIFNEECDTQSIKDDKSRQQTCWQVGGGQEFGHDPLMSLSLEFLD